MQHINACTLSDKMLRRRLLKQRSWKNATINKKTHSNLDYLHIGAIQHMNHDQFKQKSEVACWTTRQKYVYNSRFRGHINLVSLSCWMSQKRRATRPLILDTSTTKRGRYECWLFEICIHEFKHHLTPCKSKNCISKLRRRPSGLALKQDHFNRNDKIGGILYTKLPNSFWWERRPIVRVVKNNGANHFAKWYPAGRWYPPFFSRSRLNETQISLTLCQEAVRLAGRWFFRN